MKVMCSSPDEVIGLFNLPNPSALHVRVRACVDISQYTGLYALIPVGSILSDCLTSHLVHISACL
jgi:hypothetical protein